jgi:hypothetical protein
MEFAFISSAIFKTTNANTKNNNHNTCQDPDSGVIMGNINKTNLIKSCSSDINIESVFASNISITLSHIHRYLFYSGKSDLFGVS